MNTEQTGELERRAAIYGALADPARLQIVDILSASDASPSELARTLAMPSNLLAHHLNVLEAQRLVVRRRSEGDHRRTYIQLAHDALVNVAPVGARSARRVLFVCTANSARSHLAAALWRQASDVPSISAGTHPAERIDPRTLAAAKRHQLPLRRTNPQRMSDVESRGDLIVTVCDLAHEELGERTTLHWSIPDPVRVGDDDAFDQALEGIAQRISEFAPHLVAS
jgi:ArsR family transcriptional regulator, arsenate/arsenite/antimonite-responsive transcriptional repressor / arsenate reductase (thioredoxin)